MTYLLWSQDQNEGLLDLTDSKNFKLFLKQMVTLVKNKPLVVSEKFYQVLNKHLPSGVASKFNFKYILTNNLSFVVPNATTCDKPEKIIADFNKFIDNDLYVIGDLTTIHSFFTKTDYLVVFTFNCQNSKIIKKIDCINFGNHIVLDKKNISPNCICSIYSKQSSNY